MKRLIKREIWQCLPNSCKSKKPIDFNNYEVTYVQQVINVLSKLAPVSWPSDSISINKKYTVNDSLLRFSGRYPYESNWPIF